MLRPLRFLALAVLAALTLGAAAGCVYDDYYYDGPCDEPVVRVHAPPPPAAIVVVGHAHYAGCGHYFWHGGWYGYPHPYDCAYCGSIYGGPRVSIGVGIGPVFGYRHYYGGPRGYRRICR